MRLGEVELSHINGVDMFKLIENKCLWIRIAIEITIALLTVFTDCVYAAYKPVDVSDIKGVKRKELMETVKKVRQLPPITRECFLAEQLGLMFCKDGSQSMFIYQGAPGTCHYQGKAFFAGRGQRPMNYSEVDKSKFWGEIYEEVKFFKKDAALGFFRKDVETVVRNTAKYLLKNMPDEHRWALLATFDKKIYHQDGSDAWKGYRTEATMDCGIKYIWHGDTDRALYTGPDGKERKIKDIYEDPVQRVRYTRWRQIVERCENLIGAKDILALFPEEVEAIREQYKAYKERLADAEKEQMSAVADMLNALSEDERNVRLAAAMGLYFHDVDYRSSPYNSNQYLNPGSTIMLPDGRKITNIKGYFCLADGSPIILPDGEKMVAKPQAPGALSNLPHELILERFKEPIQQMARLVAKERFHCLPPTLRVLLRAELSGQLTTWDNSSPVKGKGFISIETFDRQWNVPRDEVDRSTALFTNSEGNKIPYKIISSYENNWWHTIHLVFLCVRILSWQEVLDYLPE